MSGLNWIRLNVSYPAVVNMSLGGMPNCFSVRDAMDALIAANILVFKAAGNDSVDAFQDRANRSAGSVIAGGVAPFDALTTFSDWGPTVSLFAPAQNMLLATSAFDWSSVLWSGTSFSSPLEAGAAAVFLQGNPTLTAGELKNFVLTNASPATLLGANGAPNRTLFTNILPLLHRRQLFR